MIASTVPATRSESSVIFCLRVRIAHLRHLKHELLIGLICADSRLQLLANARRGAAEDACAKSPASVLMTAASALIFAARPGVHRLGR